MSENKTPPIDICDDEQVKAARAQTMEKMKWGPMIGSVSRAAAMIGGPLFGTGLMGILVLSKADPTLFMPLAIAATIGAALSLGAIALDYVGTRWSQSAGLDQTEVGAKSTARHLVQELKSNNMCFLKTQECEAPARADGKSWAGIEREKPACQIQRG